MKRIVKKSKIAVNTDKNGITQGFVLLQSEDLLFIEAVYKFQKLIENHNRSAFETFIDIVKNI